MKKNESLENQADDLLSYHILCIWKLKYKAEALPDEEPEENTLDKIGRSLGEGLLDIESMLPIGLRKKDIAYLCLRDENTKITAEWHESINPKPNAQGKIITNDLERMFSDSARSSGEFTYIQSQALGKVITDYLMRSPAGVISYLTPVKHDKNETWLKRKP